MWPRTTLKRSRPENAACARRCHLTQFDRGACPLSLNKRGPIISLNPLIVGPVLAALSLWEYNSCQMWTQIIATGLPGPLRVSYTADSLRESLVSPCIEVDSVAGLVSGIRKVIVVRPTHTLCICSLPLAIALLLLLPSYVASGLPTWNRPSHVLERAREV